VSATRPAVNHAKSAPRGRQFRPPSTPRSATSFTEAPAAGRHNRRAAIPLLASTALRRCARHRAVLELADRPANYGRGGPLRLLEGSCIDPLHRMPPRNRSAHRLLPLLRYGADFVPRSVGSATRQPRAAIPGRCGRAALTRLYPSSNFGALPPILHTGGASGRPYRGWHCIVRPTRPTLGSSFSSPRPPSLRCVGAGGARA
jgi:hypothetical protein